MVLSQEITMKKIAIILFALILAFSFAGCQNDIVNDEPEITTATDDDLKLAAYYLKAFGHDRIIGDTDAILKGVKVEGLTATPVFDKENGILTFTVELKDYDYDGHADNDVLGIYQRLATGGMTVVYKGTVSGDGKTFTAATAEFIDVSGILSVGYASAYPVDSIAVACDKATVSFTDKDKAAASSVVFTVTDGKISGISNAGEVSFALKDAANVTINGRIVESTVPEEPDTPAVPETGDQEATGTETE